MAAMSSHGANPPNVDEVMRSARHLVSLLTSFEGQSGATGAGPSTSSQATTSQDIARQHISQGQSATVQRVHTEMTRSFPGQYSKARGKRRFPAADVTPVKPVKSLPVVFYLLPKPCERTPKGPEELVHMQAGLGRRTTMLDENTTHDELCDKLHELYPKMKVVTGGWLLYKAAGGWGSRKLSLIVPDDCGYTGRTLKMANQGGKGVLYIAALQEELDTSPLPPDADSFNNMPKAQCQTCQTFYPLQVLALHVKSCNTIVVDDKDNDGEACCPICLKEISPDLLAMHASSCGESTSAEELDLSHLEWSSNSNNAVDRELSVSSTTPLQSEAACSDHRSEVAHSDHQSEAACSDDNDWKTHPDPKVAESLYTQRILCTHETGKLLRMSMDLRRSIADQERELIAFYKMPNVEWACPVHCKLEGDAAIGVGVTRYFFSSIVKKLKYGFKLNLGNTDVTRLFEGEPDHLVPSSSQFLIESDLYLMAGRMLGHSFLHSGPRLSGISQSIAHVLLGGSPETATIQLEDCPDYDIRETIKLLDGDADLTGQERQAVQDLALSWDLPGPTETNRKWLFERLLMHAVIGRTTRQVKQIRRGLKETMVWPLLIERKDVVLFPTESEDSYTPEMVIPHILWPNQQVTDDDDEEYPLETKCRIAGYLRQFIQNASSQELKDLLKFWVGWEVPTADLKMEVVESDLPKSSTCFQTLRIPGHYSD